MVNGIHLKTGNQKSKQGENMTNDIDNVFDSSTESSFLLEIHQARKKISLFPLCLAHMLDI